MPESLGGSERAETSAIYPVLAQTAKGAFHFFAQRREMVK
jgi:hypothetical protein